MKLGDKLKVRRAFVDAMEASKMENGFNSHPALRAVFHASLMLPSFYKAVEQDMKDKGMSVDEYVARVPETFDEDFSITIPS